MKDPVFAAIGAGGLATQQALSTGLTREDALQVGTREIRTRIRDWPRTVDPSKGKVAEVADSLEAIGASVGAAWAENALATVRLGARLAASLGATTLPEEYVSDLQLPWRCFRIVVPAGVFDEDEASILVLRRHNGTFFTLTVAMSLVSMGEEPTFEGFAGMQLAWSAQTVDQAAPEDLVDLDPRTRVTALLHQVVIGTCVELASTTPHPQPPRRWAGVTRRGLTPHAWEFQLTRDVRIDCRQSLRDYVASGRRAPTVLSLVRGHYKRQTCGPGGADRRWIHVEPYWRGPEDAPIALRAHTLGRAGAS